MDVKMPKWMKGVDFFTNIVQVFQMTPEELDNLYTEEAKQIGHRLFLIKQFENEIEVRIKRCDDLASQKAKLEAEKVKNVSEL